MSTTIESSRMSDMTPFQEAAAWLGGLGAAGAAGLTIWSKLMRGLSSDRQAIQNDQAGQRLYDLLVNENKRIDARNRELEIQNQSTLQRLAQLEIIHSKLMMVTSENQTLKKLAKNKDAQLTNLLNQQRQEREQNRLRLKEYDTTIEQLTLKVEQLEAATLAHPATGDRRMEDRLQPTDTLTFEEQ